MRRPLSLSCVAVGSALLACSGGTASSPPSGPSIVADTTKCTAGLTTIATIDASNYQRVQAFAVGADGAVYFVETGGPGMTGVFKVAAPGAAPVLLTDFANAFGMWAEGDTLWLASGVGLSSMPVAGGQPTQVGSFPDTQTNTLYAEVFVLDATSVYTIGHRQNGAQLEAWRMGRADGRAQLLFQSDDAAMSSTWIGPLVADADALYFVGTSTIADAGMPNAIPGSNTVSTLFRLPKAGGTPTIARNDMGDLNQLLKVALFGKDFYANVMPLTSPTDSRLGRFPLDSDLAPGAHRPRRRRRRWRARRGRRGRLRGARVGIPGVDDSGARADPDRYGVVFGARVHDRRRREAGARPGADGPRWLARLRAPSGPERPLVHDCPRRALAAHLGRQR